MRSVTLLFFIILRIPRSKSNMYMEKCDKIERFFHTSHMISYFLCKKWKIIKPISHSEIGPKLKLPSYYRPLISKFETI